MVEVVFRLYLEEMFVSKKVLLLFQIQAPLFGIHI